MTAPLCVRFVHVRYDGPATRRELCYAGRDYAINQYTINGRAYRDRVVEQHVRRDGTVAMEITLAETIPVEPTGGA